MNEIRRKERIKKKKRLYTVRNETNEVIGREKK